VVFSIPHPLVQRQLLISCVSSCSEDTIISGANKSDGHYTRRALMMGMKIVSEIFSANFSVTRLMAQPSCPLLQEKYYRIKGLT
jgi:hypothetical protein